MRLYDIRQKDDKKKTEKKITNTSLYSTPAATKLQKTQPTRFTPTLRPRWPRVTFITPTLLQQSSPISPRSAGLLSDSEDTETSPSSPTPPPRQRLPAPTTIPLATPIN
ncbi:hypothetical protein HOY82DRAFT_542382 [Tuber indicum]|nr:hypothetical protein HOY82DRAFT_542382 [Tuber indicum]